MSELPGGRVIPPDFDSMYAEDANPWGVDSSWYERRKLAVLLATLPRERYSSTWEPGCGPGITTRALAGRTDHLAASDASVVAVDLARQRCADLQHVTVTHRSVTDGCQDTSNDLVVAAEFLYYVDDLDAAADAMWHAASSGGHLAVMHWAHHPHDAFVSGAAVHDHISAQAGRRAAPRLVTHAEHDFLLDIYEVR